MFLQFLLLNSPCPHHTPNFPVFMLVIDVVSRPQLDLVICSLQKELLILELVTFVKQAAGSHHYLGLAFPRGCFGVQQ